MKKKTVSDVIFQNLARKGIDTCFMVTGGGAMFLNDALQRNKSRNKNNSYLDKKIKLLINKLKSSKRPILIAVNGIRFSKSHLLFKQQFFKKLL